MYAAFVLYGVSDFVAFMFSRDSVPNPNAQVLLQPQYGDSLFFARRRK